MAFLEKAYKLPIANQEIAGTISATTDPNTPTIFPTYAADILEYNDELYINDPKWFGHYIITKSVKDGDVIKTNNGRFGIVHIKKK
jgi:hypothetical protein